MRIDDYIGQEIDVFLRQDPWRKWQFARCAEDADEEGDANGVTYVSSSHGLEVACSNDGLVCTVFVRLERYDGPPDAIYGISRAQSRSDLILEFGRPSASGEPSRSPVLGESGAWDRFAKATSAMHAEYAVDGTVRLLTFMANSAIPE